MSNLLEVRSVDTLLQTTHEVVLFEPQSEAQLLEVPTVHILLEPADNNQLIETVERVVLLEIAKQGPPGPPGPPGSGSGAQAILVDYSNETYAYLGYPARICRIDYSVSPPTARYAAVSDLVAEWPTRTGLTYT